MSVNRNKDSWTSVSHEYRVRIEQDNSPDSPRDNDSNGGYMVCWHRHYHLGDTWNGKGEFVPRDKWSVNPKVCAPASFFEALALKVVAANYPEALLISNVEKIARKQFIILPLYLYDHSGISISTSNAYPFNCPWDAGQVGWIYFPRADLKKEGWSEAKAVEYLKNEVKEYDNYLTGNCWGYIIERQRRSTDNYASNGMAEDGPMDDEWDEVESVWGFIGEVYEGAYDPETYIKADLEEMLKTEQAEIDDVATRLLTV